MFSSLFSITLPNIEKYFPGIHFPGIYFPRNSISKKKPLSCKQGASNTFSKLTWQKFLMGSCKIWFNEDYIKFFKSRSDVVNIKSWQNTKLDVSRVQHRLNMRSIVWFRMKSVKIISIYIFYFLHNHIKKNIKKLIF